MMKSSYFSFIEVVKGILSSKDVFMGIAIIMVVLYHYDTGLRFQKLFYSGFLGVDIFLFFSGYGLCRSYETHDLISFYKRRLVRILPMFLLLAIVKCCLFVASGGNLTVVDWICTLTTLSYWGFGGIFVDWYLCSLFVLYLVFPILYSLPCRRGGVILCISLITIALSCDFDWSYQCFIERIPIFLVGIYCYRYDATEVMKRAVLLFAMSFVVAAGLWVKHIVHTYTLLYTLSPFVIIGIGVCCNYFRNDFKWLKWLGKHSLEIYVTNCIVMKLVSYDWMVAPSVMYWVLLFILTPIVFKINHLFVLKR